MTPQSLQPQTYLMKKLTKKQKEVLDKAIKKVLKEYKKALELLGKN